VHFPLKFLNFLAPGSGFTKSLNPDPIRIHKPCVKNHNLYKNDGGRFSWLPVTEDVDEAPFVYGFLADLVEANSSHVLGINNSNLPRWEREKKSKLTSAFRRKISRIPTENFPHSDGKFPAFRRKISRIPTENFPHSEGKFPAFRRKISRNVPIPILKLWNKSSPKSTFKMDIFSLGKCTGTYKTADG
jgi:hypothetical protein